MELPDYEFSRKLNTRSLNICYKCKKMKIVKKQYYNKLRNKFWLSVYRNTEIYNEYKEKIRKPPLTRIKNNLRNRMRKILKSKSTKHSLFVGCSSAQLRKHIEVQFKQGMSWKNYGIHWVIDHIKPIKKYNLNNEEELKLVNHYSNLQPMLVKDNLRKSDNYE